MSANVRGSSPHTWGILRGDVPQGIPARFIPTYVGHTSRSGQGAVLPSVHPHIRGAYFIRPTYSTGSPGSSPHTWGILIMGSKTAGSSRFIPTYVGHTMVNTTDRRRDAVHPHIRGAYLARCYLDDDLYGSSPHTWGIPQVDVHAPDKLRGSSPHTWGIPPGQTPARPGNRFIPTYGGHTWMRRGIWPKPAVHPHIRGAYRALGGPQPPPAVHPHIRGAYAG